MGRKEDVISEEFVVTQDFCGPKIKRKCSDVLFLILLLVCWAVMTCVGLAALGVIRSDQLDKGNPDRLIRGVDYKGNICGVDGKVKNYDKKWEPSILNEFGICVKSCPSEGESRVDVYTGDTYTADIKTVDVVGYCIPVVESRQTNLALDTFGDFIRSAALIGVTGFVFSVILCYTYLYFIRTPYMLHIIVWVNIFIVEVGLIIGAYLMSEKAKAERDSDDSSAMSDDQIAMLQGLGAVLAIMAVLWVCVICFLRERIGVAVDLVEEAADCVTSLGNLPLFCCLLVATFVLFSALWLLYTTYLVSSAEITTHTDKITGVTYKEFEYSQRAKQSVIFMVFMWLWTTAFIQAIGQLSFSHAALVWYFAESRDIIGDYQIFYSLKTMVWYHSGTAAFGSLILAVVNMIRIVLTYVKKKFGDSENCFNRCITKSLFCCLKCFEECIKFINKHAYIQCAFHGKGFMYSALRAYGLIARNILRVAVVSVVGSLAIFIGKISIMVICAGLAYLYLDNFMEDQVTGFFFPTAFVAFIAYLTASFFLDILSVTTDTLLQAFLIEEEFDRNAKKGNGSAVSKKKSHAGGGITRVVEATANNRFTRTSVTAPEDDHAQL